MIFLLVALQVQQHEVLFGRVAALQYAVLFASLKKTNWETTLQNYSFFRVFRGHRVLANYSVPTLAGGAYRISSSFNVDISVQN